MVSPSHVRCAKCLSTVPTHDTELYSGNIRICKHCEETGGKGSQLKCIECNQWKPYGPVQYKTDICSSCASCSDCGQWTYDPALMTKADYRCIVGLCTCPTHVQ